MHYPLHLGVTEAGDGEDGRIKGAIGIGSLLLDGLGDTIRVSLTEDSVYEIPVARALADKAMSLWRPGTAGAPESDSIDPYHFERRETATVPLAAEAVVGPEHPPRVIVRIAGAGQAAAALKELSSPRLKETPAEGLLVPVGGASDLEKLGAALRASAAPVRFLVLEPAPAVEPGDLEPFLKASAGRILVLRRFVDGESLARWSRLARSTGHFLAVDASPSEIAGLSGALGEAGDDRLVVTFSGIPAQGADHAVGAYRRIVEALRSAGIRAPVWIRNTAATAVRGDNSFLSRLIEASILTGSLLCDGVGDLVSVETEPDPARAARIAYNVLQGAGRQDLEGGVRRVPELRAHALRPSDDYPAHPRPDRRTSRA